MPEARKRERERERERERVLTGGSLSEQAVQGSGRAIEVRGEQRDVAVSECRRHLQDAERDVELVVVVERLSVLVDAEPMAARVEVVRVLLEVPTDGDEKLTSSIRVHKSINRRLSAA